MRLQLTRALALSALVVAGAGCGVDQRPHQADRTPAAGIAPIDVDRTVVAVERGSVTERVVATGRVEIDDQEPVAAPTPGEIVAVSARMGDTIEAGAVLAEIAPAPGVVIAALELEAARLAVDQAAANDGDAAELAMLASRLEAAERTAAELDLPPELIGAGVDAVVAVVAPIDGIVVDVPSIGEAVEAGDVIARVGDGAGLTVLAEIDDAEVDGGADPAVAVGDEIALVRQSGATTEEPGRVVSIDRGVVRLAVDDAGLRAGERVRLALPGRAWTDVLVVPADAVRRFAGDTSVLTVADGDLRRVAIEVLVETDGRAVVEGELAAGDQVVVP
ncbi:MAG: efflux RND transporter periplasmic adaptor subunit [Actinomycetota bacterium]